ncbi:MAG: folate family ECF transporter S component [Bacillota bacterium]|nr:folate family ECF transporter S component [Bacillota bacterium]
MSASFNRPPERRPVYRLALAALFVALSVILTRLLSVIVIGGAFRPELGHVPIQLAGLLLGPGYGGLVGLAADLVGAIALPQGAFHPGFTLSSVLVGVLPGLAVTVLRSGIARRGQAAERGKDRGLILVLLLATVAGDWAVAQFLSTFWLSGLLGTPWSTLFALRLVPVAVRSLLNGAVLALVLRVFEQLPLPGVALSCRLGESRRQARRSGL